MATNLHTLNLTWEQLSHVRDALHQRILNGLGAHDQEIKALPAYIPRPSSLLSGDAVVLDVGGTNIRAAWVRLHGAAADFHGTSIADDVLLQRAKIPKQVDARQFFTKQADLIAKVCSASTINVGYCFSYPATITPQGQPFQGVDIL